MTTLIVVGIIVLLVFYFVVKRSRAADKMDEDYYEGFKAIATETPVVPVKPKRVRKSTKKTK